MVYCKQINKNTKSKLLFHSQSHCVIVIKSHLKIEDFMKYKINKNKFFLLGFSLITLLSIILRFYNYSNRWLLWVDQASFALLTRYALFNHKIPLLGLFSSAGPFQTGGEWFWLLMFIQSFYPSSLITQWVGVTILSVVFVMIIMLFAKELGGKKLGIIVGLLSAVSTVQIVQSANLTSHSVLSLIALFALWFAIKYFKQKQGIYLFLLSFIAGLAPTIHVQGFMLIPLVFIALFLSGTPSIKKLAIIFFGLFLPWIPIFIADSNNNFFNTRNMIIYYLHDQYKISLDVLGRRWLTYLGIFWPQAWANIIGGNPIAGYVIPVISIIFGVKNVYKKNISREWLFIVLSFFAMLVIIRYARVTLYDSNFLVIHPIILLITGWTILNCFKLSRIIGIILLFIIVAFSLNIDIQTVVNSKNNVMLLEMERNILLKRFPNTKFAIYDHKFQTPGISQSLTLFLDEKNKIDDDGKKIGFSIATFSAKLKLPIIYKSEDMKPYYILDISGLSDSQLSSYGWESVNPSAIYRNVQEWYKYKK